MVDARRCACGKPLHYTSQKAQIEQLIRVLGPEIKVTVEGRTWWVPRHYIALHGIVGAELPTVAASLGFREVRS